MSADEIKIALAASAEEFTRSLFPNGCKESNEWRVGSLNGEAGQSLAICISGRKAGIFKDFATDESGDNLIELLAQARGLPFKNALHAAAEWLGAPVTAERYFPRYFPVLKKLSAAESECAALPLPMAESDCRLALAMATALQQDHELCERIARSRNWRVESIVELAHEPSLGWQDGKLAFLYESGVKLRWREDGERVIKWAFGEPWLWRGGLLWNRSTAYICEGETDAISLIDARFEKDGETVVVAIPSATTFKDEWAVLFKDKEVILALDCDAAGLRATTKIAGLLGPVVGSLKQLDWGGLQNAS